MVFSSCISLKKDGSVRFCIDYRKVNNITRKDVYPLPRIDDTLDTLSGAKWFSTLDLLSGCWQAEVTAEDQKKTAFVTWDDLFEFNVMPIGLCNGPTTFQRLMDTVLLASNGHIALFIWMTSSSSVMISSPI